MAPLWAVTVEHKWILRIILFQKLKESGTEMRLSVFGKFDEAAIDKGEMVGIGLPSSSCKPAHHSAHSFGNFIAPYSTEILPWDQVDCHTHFAEKKKKDLIPLSPVSLWVGYRNCTVKNLLCYIQRYKLPIFARLANRTNSNNWKNRLKSMHNAS